MECGGGYERQCRVSDAGGRPLYRPRSYEAEERRRKKALTKTSWYRPADAALFIPATPGEELKKNIEKVVTEELERIGMTAKVVETGGVTMRSMLVRTDLTGCIIPACVLCASARRGTLPMPGWRPTDRRWRPRRTAMLSTSTWSSTIQITFKTSVFLK